MEEDQVVKSVDGEKKSSQSATAGIVAFLAAKGGILLKALKALKFLKYGITMITMAISALLYGFTFGSWWFGLGFVVLILIHEMGHVAAMARRGMPTSAPVFIPFLGAAIFVPAFRDRDEEAYVGIGGPFIGSIGALLFIAAAFMFPSGSKPAVVLHLLGNVGLFVNLFNMIPSKPLDGGRILSATGRWVGYIGFPLLLIFAILTKDVFFVLIALMALNESPYRIRSWVARMLFGCWFVFAAFDAATDFSKFTWLTVLFLSVFSVGALLAFVYAWVGRNEPLREIKHEEVEVVALPPSIRIKWAVLYSLLLIGLLAAMAWHGKYLPTEVREHSLVHFIS